MKKLSSILLAICMLVIFTSFLGVNETTQFNECITYRIINNHKGFKNFNAVEISNSCDVTLSVEYYTFLKDGSKKKAFETIGPRKSKISVAMTDLVSATTIKVTEY